ncbi:glycoside hydrolase family 13 protein [Piscibacillus halophilus]|uniref:glycoside hydrolase family 13 protein n=1 Tax=Piscibacillus halophilus TaxID=571933 RepID=UPI00158B665C|nr:alpha-glucosidase [Piscibacillus halophilus]
MTEKKWWKESVVYQIYPRSFYDSNQDGIGDLKGIIQKLDYFVDLGVDVIWICPMYQSPNDDNGYDISDYQSIMEEFGTMEDFDRLLDEAHDRGLKVILDLVLNHTSDEHQWFIESRSAKDHPKRDWYIWRDQPNNWESIFGGSAWEYDDKTGQYYLHIFSKKQPDLNWENEEVRHNLYDMVNWWLDKGIDGFRIDAISHIKKTDGLPDAQNPEGKPYAPAWEHMMNVDGIHDFLEELNQQTFSNYDIMTVAEANGVGTEDIHQWVGQSGKFNMVFQFEHLALWDGESNKDLNIIELKETLTRWQKTLERDGWNALFIENHDIPRVTSTWGNDSNYWRESATALGAMYFFMKGTPFIYQGQEIGMTNSEFKQIGEFNDVRTINHYYLKKQEGYNHEEIMAILNKTSRDHSRTPMQWNNQDHAGFSQTSPWLKVNDNYEWLNVEKQQNDEGSVLSFYKKMIKLRRQYDVFIYGQYELQMADHPTIFSYTREYEGVRMLIVTNLSEQPAVMDSFDIDKLLLSNDSDASSNVLNPYEARVYKLK